MSWRTSCRKVKLVGPVEVSGANFFKCPALALLGQFGSSPQLGILSLETLSKCGPSNDTPFCCCGHGKLCFGGEAVSSMACENWGRANLYCTITFKGNAEGIVIWGWLYMTIHAMPASWHLQCRTRP